MLSQAGPPTAATDRVLWPGYADGLSSLGRGVVGEASIGIYEEDESTYSLEDSLEEEDKMFQINESVRNLLDSLEKNNKVVEQKDEDQT
jgi:hypothetical protein